MIYEQKYTKENNAFFFSFFFLPQTGPHDSLSMFNNFWRCKIKKKKKKKKNVWPPFLNVFLFLFLFLFLVFFKFYFSIIFSYFERNLIEIFFWESGFQIWSRERFREMKISMLALFWNGNCFSNVFVLFWFIFLFLFLFLFIYLFIYLFICLFIYLFI